MEPTRASGEILNNADHIFNSFNHDAVSNNPSILPVFTTSRPYYIYGILNYHWNEGAGQDPAAVNGMISLYDDTTNLLIGSWAAENSPQYPPATYWVAYPRLILPAGIYRIEDSDRATWSYSTTQFFGVVGADWKPNQGFSQVFGTPEPSTLVLLGSLAVVGVPAGIVWRRRKLAG
jgi:PEP-CTERM motif